MKYSLKTLGIVTGIMVHILNAASTEKVNPTESEDPANELLEKCKLPKSDPLNQTPQKQKSVQNLTVDEQEALMRLADKGNLDAQHYVWLGVSRGLYGFSKSTELALQLKAVYKKANNVRKFAKQPETPKE
jgi:hypothetical protein